MSLRNTVVPVARPWVVLLWTQKSRHRSSEGRGTRSHSWYHPGSAQSRDGALDHCGRGSCLSNRSMRLSDCPVTGATGIIYFRSVDRVRDAARRSFSDRAGVAFQHPRLALRAANDRIILATACFDCGCIVMIYGIEVKEAGRLSAR